MRVLTKPYSIESLTSLYLVVAPVNGLDSEDTINSIRYYVNGLTMRRIPEDSFLFVSYFDQQYQLLIAGFITPLLSHYIKRFIL